MFPFTRFLPFYIAYKTPPVVLIIAGRCSFSRVPYVFSHFLAPDFSSEWSCKKNENLNKISRKQSFIIPALSFKKPFKKNHFLGNASIRKFEKQCAHVYSIMHNTMEVPSTLQVFSLQKSFFRVEFYHSSEEFFSRIMSFLLGHFFKILPRWYRSWKLPKAKTKIAD